MAGQLSEHQRKALDAYEALIEKHPALFEGRNERPIVRDRKLLAAYAAKQGVVLGVSAETPYALFVVDLVESRRRDGHVRRHPYLRVVSCAQLDGGVNVVVLGTIEDPLLGKRGDIVLVEQERHALGTHETELPRGFGEPGLSGEENALHELERETGYVGDRANLLGATASDSGLMDEIVCFYHVPVLQRTERRPEMEEAIRRILLATPVEAWNSIKSGAIRDAFTLQALALYEKTQSYAAHRSPEGV
jgi:ADP-ribose diphosphatase